MYGIIQYERAEKSFNQMFLTKFHESLWESNESHEIALLTKTVQIYTQNCAYSSKRFMVTPTTVLYLTCLGNPWTKGYEILSNPNLCVRLKGSKVNWYLQATYLLSTRSRVIQEHPQALSSQIICSYKEDFIWKVLIQSPVKIWMYVDKVIKYCSSFILF